MVQRLSSLGQGNEKFQDDGEQTSTGSQQGIAIQKEEFDKTQMKDSLHGQEKGAEEASSQLRDDEAKLSKEEKEGKEHGTQSGKLFISKGGHSTQIYQCTQLRPTKHEKRDLQSFSMVLSMRTVYMVRIRGGGGHSHIDMVSAFEGSKSAIFKKSVLLFKILSNLGYTLVQILDWRSNLDGKKMLYPCLGCSLV